MPHTRFLLALRVLAYFSTFGTVAFSQPGVQPKYPGPQVTRNYDSLTLGFEQNVGQANMQARYLSHGAGFSIFFTDAAAIIALSKMKAPDSAPKANRPTPKEFTSDILGMHLEGGRRHSAPYGEGMLPGTVNYFQGSDPSKWLSAVSTFEKIRYANVYPGVDVVYHGNLQHLEFDFEIAANASARSIRLRFAGARKLRVDPNGDLTVIAANGQIGFHAPVIYQNGPDKERQFVAGAFRVLTKDTVGFQIGKYDHNRPIVIDPILSFSTYLGHSDIVNAITADSAGNAYITGWTRTDFPITPGALQPLEPPKIFSDNPAAFVTKINSTGTGVVYSTYLGGSGVDIGTAIAVDIDGNAYVAGETNSIDFPVATGAFQPVNRSAPNSTGFICKLNSTGTSLIYSTFLGGSQLNTPPALPDSTSEDFISSIRVDETGNLYVAGTTDSSDFPVTSGAFQSTSSTRTYGTGFVSKLNSTGSRLIYSTLLGGSADDQVTGATIDSTGNTYVVGTTTSMDFPVTPNAFQTTHKPNQNWTSFLTKLAPDGSKLLYSTYLGGSRDDVVYAVAVDSAGSAYLTGFTVSEDFPITPGVVQPSLKKDSQNAFVTKFNSTGTALVYSTFLGGSANEVGGVGEDEGVGIAVDAEGNAVVIGTTDSTDFPLTSGALQTQNTTWIESLDRGSFLFKLNVTSSSLLYSTYLGGSGDLSTETCDCVGSGAIALDPYGNAYVAGRTVSTDFPTTLGAIQTSPSGMFVTKFNRDEMKILLPTTTTVKTDVNPQEAGLPVNVTVRVIGTGNTTPSGNIGVSVNGDPWSSYALDSAGTFVYSTNLLPGGPDTIVTYYLGDANNAPSANYFQQSITSGSAQLPVTITVVPSANPVDFGKPVGFTVSVTDSSGKGIPEGYVTLVFNFLEIIRANLDASGHATLSTSSLPPGTNRLDVNFFPSNGNYSSAAFYFSEVVTPLGVTSTPVISPISGTYATAQTVTISDAMPSARIYYTTGSPPQCATVWCGILYTGPFVLNSSATIYAIAALSGYSDSSTSMTNFVVGPHGTAAAPTFSAAAGTFTSAISVSLSDAVPAAVIYYTTDASVPTTSSTRYLTPIAVSTSETINAIAVATGYFNSAVASAAYTINPLPPDFSFMLSSSSVTISSGNAAQSTLNIASIGGFNQPVTFSCSGLPAGAACSFSPASIVPGATSSAVLLTINSLKAENIFFPVGPLGVSALAILIGIRRRVGSPLYSNLLLVSTVLLFSGCAGGTVSHSLPSTAVVTVTAKSASVNHSETLTITVTPN